MDDFSHIWSECRDVHQNRVIDTTGRWQEALLDWEWGAHSHIQIRIIEIYLQYCTTMKSRESEIEWRWMLNRNRFRTDSEGGKDGSMTFLSVSVVRSDVVHSRRWKFQMSGNMIFISWEHGTSSLRRQFNPSETHSEHPCSWQLPNRWIFYFFPRSQYINPLR